MPTYLIHAPWWKWPAKRMASVPSLRMGLISFKTWWNHKSTRLPSTRRARLATTLLAVLLVIPGFLRDAVYDWIGRRRYRMFGKRDLKVTGLRKDSTRHPFSSAIRLRALSGFTTTGLPTLSNIGRSVGESE